MIRRILLALSLLLLLALGGMAAYGYFLGDDQTARTVAVPVTQDSGDTVARGAYLARAGNCMGCHTARGGAAYAGGRVIQS
ncbi:MAG: cytochrome c, partial [Undibacterium sp.]|nr:cytochrome c [Undibacterium sp.]